MSNMAAISTSTIMMAITLRFFFPVKKRNISILHIKDL